MENSALVTANSPWGNSEETRARPTVAYESAFVPAHFFRGSFSAVMNNPIPAMAESREQSGLENTHSQGAVGTR